MKTNIEKAIEFLDQYDECLEYQDAWKTVCGYVDFLRETIDLILQNKEKGNILKSKYTPGLINGKEVSFQQGDIVKYRMRNGREFVIVIDSKRMQHESGFYGYESIFDDGERCFAVEDGIYDWDGKR